MHGDRVRGVLPPDRISSWTHQSRPVKIGVVTSVLVDDTVTLGIVPQSLQSTMGSVERDGAGAGTIGPTQSRLKQAQAPHDRTRQSLPHPALATLRSASPLVLFRLLPTASFSVVFLLVYIAVKSYQRNVVAAFCWVEQWLQ